MKDKSIRVFEHEQDHEFFLLHCFVIVFEVFNKQKKKGQLTMSL